MSRIKKKQLRCISVAVQLRTDSCCF